jgi:hypothetical protein
MPEAIEGQEPTAPGTDSGQEPVEGQPQAGTKTYDEKYVSELRKEAAANRKAKNDLEGRLKAIEDAQLSEQEKAAKRLQELEAKEQAYQERERQLLRENTIALAVAATDAKYPDLVKMRLEAAELEAGEDGRPTAHAVEAALKDIRREYPDLFKAATMPPSGGPNNAPRQGGRALTREAVQGMTPEQRATAWADGTMQEFLRNQNQPNK